MVIKQICVKKSPKGSSWDDKDILREKFPKKYEFSVDSSVVYLVGENGSGKTCLLRMIYSAVKGDNNFLSLSTTEHPHLHAIGFSPVAGNVADYSKTSIKQQWIDDYLQFDPGKNRLIDTYGVDGPSKKQVFSIGEGRSLSPGTGVTFKIREYFQRIENYFSDEAQRKRDHYLKVSAENDEQLQKRGITLPGHPSFWTEEYNQALECIGGLSMDNYVPPEVRDKAKLVVLMDEPTVFLSYRNKYKFLNDILKSIEKYQDRIQFFITTNDAVLIEQTKNALFVDVDKKPVISLTSYHQDI